MPYLFRQAAALCAALTLLVPAALAQPAVTDLALYNADTDQQLGLLATGDTLDLAALPTTNLSIVANASGNVGSVRFAFAGNPDYQTENVAPYALGGDTGGDFNPVPELAQPGAYTLTATPFTGTNGGGQAGDALAVQLTVVQGDDPPPTNCTGDEGDYTVEGTRSASGQLMAWHPVTITLTGPCLSEDGAPNPFLDYRLDVQFTSYDDGSGFTVPGYFAADGDAANTGATSGNKWRAHATLPAGSWAVSFETYEGPGVAIADDPGTPGGAGTALVLVPSEACDGVTDCRDNRGKGVLRYVGERYLRFDNGEYFVKGGADSPENLLAYVDFDDTFDTNGQAKTWAPHVADWNPGDPTWAGGRGKGLIGALNYLASEGMNAFSFLPFNNPLGDGRDVWPWTTPGQSSTARLRYDVSKLDQWEIVFTHADSLGLFLHFKTQETENDQVLDGGALGTERKLYYRELVARFGHHLALNWNLGEENTNTTTQRAAFAEYFDRLDAYDRPIVIHTYPGQKEQVYGPLLGDPHMTGASLQLSSMNGGHDQTLEWLDRSAAAGRPWHVAIDEPGNANTGVSCDGPGNNHTAARTEALWANLMAGGTGVEWYFGYQTCAGDLSAQDWRTRDRLWDYTRHALTFFRTHLPFWEMESADDLAADNDDYVLALPGEVYAVYAPDAGSVRLDLPSGTFDVQWFDPRDGGALQAGSVASVEGGGTRSLGTPPSDAGSDWAALVTRENPVGEVVGAVNAGGAAYTSASGVAYLADIAFSGGRTYATADPIAGTDDDALYQSARYGAFSYAAPLANGTYEVTLQFADIAPIPGTRVFSVEAEGETVVADFNIDDVADDDTAYDLTATVEVADGQLDLAFVPTTGAAGVGAIVVRTVGAAAPQSEAGPEAAASAAVPVLAYPNPARGVATFGYALDEAAPVRLTVYDALGRRVGVLVDAWQEAGSHTARLDGSALPSGVYLWRLEAGTRTESGRLVLTR
ncbi:MAG: malectin domain-containing carbohydrate-binding protein [Bacteroidota bacterium]